MAGDACIAPTNNRENIGNYTLTVGSKHASTVSPFLSHISHLIAKRSHIYFLLSFVYVLLVSRRGLVGVGFETLTDLLRNLFGSPSDPWKFPKCSESIYCQYRAKYNLDLTSSRPKSLSFLSYPKINQ